MKFHNIAEDLLSSKIKIAVIKFLVRYPSKSVSGRELARLTNSSPSSVLEALEFLRRYGIVHRRRVGKAAEWIINKRHLLVSKLLPLLRLDEESFGVLFQKVKDAFSKNSNVIKVILFGSVIKGEEHPESDLDLFVLAKENIHKKEIASKINKLNDLLIPLLGNSISAVIYSFKEFEAKRGLSLIKHISEEGKTIIDRG